jgi:hypothetical protein
MAQRSVSREDFRGLFALYACAAQLHKKHDGASRLLNLFESSRDITDDLLHLWSERVEAVSAETVGSVLCPRARAVADGEANYDHASAFLHAMLKALDQSQH